MGRRIVNDQGISDGVGWYAGSSEKGRAFFSSSFLVKQKSKVACVLQSNIL